jgi:excisionase family DNA binding protein
MLKTEDGRIWATIQEAAEKLGVSKARLAKAAKEGKIDALRLSPRAILLDWQQATFWRERYYSKRKAEVVRKRQNSKVLKLKGI